MVHLIDKDALFAEIDRIFDKHSSKHDIDEAGVVLLHLREKVENLEVKEVDINKEISQFIDANFEKAKIGHKLSLRRTAKHFFELGLKAQKGEKV